MTITNHNYNFSDSHLQSMWQVGGKLFDNKYLAIQEYIDTPQPYHFYCNDLSWDKWDWSIEPEDSMDVLCTQHALNLRRKYKTLGLGYSGGMDSHTVLQIFLRNNIHLDFIVTWRDEFADLSHPTNFEQKIAVEYLKKIKEKLRNTKVITEPSNTSFADLTRTNFLGITDITELHHENGLPQVGALNHLRNMSSHYHDLVQSDPSAALIICSDKPQMVKEENKWFWQHVDIASMEVGMPGIEYFYMSNPDPRIMIKQCHLAARYINNNYPSIRYSNDVCKTKDKQKYRDYHFALGRCPTESEVFYVKNTYSAPGYDYDCFYKNGGIKHILRFDLQREHKNKVEGIYNYHMDMHKKFPTLFNDRGVTHGWLSKKRFITEQKSP